MAVSSRLRVCLLSDMCILKVLLFLIVVATRNVSAERECKIPVTLHGLWFSRENGDNTETKIDWNSMTGRGRCVDIKIIKNDNLTVVFDSGGCYFCVRIFVRTINVLEKAETACQSLSAREKPTVENVCRDLEPNKELITLFSLHPTAKNCRPSLEGVWKFAYQNRYVFRGECKHPEANITSCQQPGTQFYIQNQQFTIYYRHCDGMEGTEDAEVQYMCLGDWYIGKNHYWAAFNTRESRLEEAYRCFLTNRDDDFFISVSITAECNILKSPQEGPERLHIEEVKPEYVPSRCKFPDNFTGRWINTDNFDADVTINLTHIVEEWKPDQGRVKRQIFICHEQRDNRFVLTRLGINGCQKDYVCFDFVPRHHNVIRYRKGKPMVSDEFAKVCSWTMFSGKSEWNYRLLIAQDPVALKCPIAGKFEFVQIGDILFETRIRGGVTDRPRPSVYCKRNISDFSVCDPDQKIITIDADYCLTVDKTGRPEDIYSEPDYKMKCIGFWKENLKSYLITYDEEDAYSRYRCWVYQRADLNRLLLSQSVGAFCHIKQDVTSYNSSEGAQTALIMYEYEREHDNCPIYFDDGTDPYRATSDQVMRLFSNGVELISAEIQYITFVGTSLLYIIHSNYL